MMKTFFAYLTFSISIAFISWIVGLIVTALVSKTKYFGLLSNLNFVRNQALNNAVGVGVTKWMAKNTFFKFFNPNLKINRPVHTSNLETLRHEMTKAESGHLFAFIFVMIFFIIKMVSHEYLLALTILIVNILMNLNPALLQQQNKRRVDQLHLKLQKDTTYN